MDQRREFALKALGTLLLGHLDPLNVSFLRTDISPQTPEKEELKQ